MTVNYSKPTVIVKVTWGTNRQETGTRQFDIWKNSQKHYNGMNLFTIMLLLGLTSCNYFPPRSSSSFNLGAPALPEVAEAPAAELEVILPPAAEPEVVVAPAAELEVILPPAAELEVIMPTKAESDAVDKTDTPKIDVDEPILSDDKASIIVPDSITPVADLHVVNVLNPVQLSILTPPKAIEPSPQTTEPVGSDSLYRIVDPGDWSGSSNPTIIVGTQNWDAGSHVSPSGSVIFLMTGGSVFQPQTTILGEGVDNIIYRIGQTRLQNDWQPFDGFQSVDNFDIGVDKVWFARTHDNPGWVHSLDGLNTRIQSAVITYVTADTSDDGVDAHEAIMSVRVSSPATVFGGMSFYQLEISFSQPDDQREAFIVLNSQPRTYDRGTIKIFGAIMGDSLGFINEWSDLGLDGSMPDVDLLPQIL